jgi:hypothetical protein
MPGTVDDFMRRFSGGGTVDDRDAAALHDRFMSTHPDDRDFDSRTYHQSATEYLGKLPDNQFHAAASNAISQAPPQEREGLLDGLLSALGGAASGGGGSSGSGAAATAGGLGALANMLGLSSTDPKQMSSDDATKLMNYARKEDPAAMQQTVQEKPWFMKALGNPIVMGALTMAAAKMLSSANKPAGQA